jgi:hypothetical protein
MVGWDQENRGGRTVMILTVSRVSVFLLRRARQQLIAMMAHSKVSKCLDHFPETFFCSITVA